MTLLIGLTGRIGCGKSTVAKQFEQRGAGIIDTDVIARSLTQSNGAALPVLRTAFGSTYFTPAGDMDRAAMRHLVFNDLAAKNMLEAILHPLIRDQAQVQIAQMQDHYPYLMLVVPLLPGSPAFQQMSDRVLVVDCDDDIQLDRITKRNQIGTDEAQRMIAQQASRATYLQLADDVIHNQTSLEAMEMQVEALHQAYLATENNN